MSSVAKLIRPAIRRRSAAFKRVFRQIPAACRVSLTREEKAEESISVSADVPERVARNIDAEYRKAQVHAAAIIYRRHKTVSSAARTSQQFHSDRLHVVCRRSHSSYADTMIRICSLINQCYHVCHSGCRRIFFDGIDDDVPIR